MQRSHREIGRNAEATAQPVVLLTWLYNESRGSLLVVALFHAGVDVAFTSAASSPFAVNTAGALITLAGVAVILTAGSRRVASQREHPS